MSKLKSFFSKSTNSAIIQEGTNTCKKFNLQISESTEWSKIETELPSGALYPVEVKIALPIEFSPNFPKWNLISEILDGHSRKWKAKNSEEKANYISNWTPRGSSRSQCTQFFYSTWKTFLTQVERKLGRFGIFPIWKNQRVCVWRRQWFLSDSLSFWHQQWSDSLLLEIRSQGKLLSCWSLGSAFAWIDK